MAKKPQKGPRWVGTGKPLETVPPLPEEEIAAAVADGILIARFSAVLALKNRLIVSALRDEHPFDAAYAAQLAVEVLDELAAEQDRNGEHALDVRGLAEVSGGAARHEHDYKARDVELINARRRVYREVAARIRLDAGSDAYLAELVEEARVKAWDELGREVGARLDITRRAASIVVDDEYLRDRDERMRRLREFDLWQLADSRYPAAAASAGAAARSAGRTAGRRLRKR